jgi:hypothetical protein
MVAASMLKSISTSRATVAGAPANHADMVGTVRSAKAETV